MKFFKTLIASLLIIGMVPMFASAQLTGQQGGTGVKGIYAGSVPFGGSALIRIATSSAFSFDSALSKLTITNASTTNLTVSGTATGTNLYGFGLATCNGASQALTWAAGLFACGTLAGDGVSNWLYNGSRLTPSSTVGIGVFASSTIGDGSGTGGLTVNGTATSTNLKVTALTASRLIATAADKIFASVSNLTSWIAGTSNEVTVADDGDGTVTVSLPATIDLGGKTSFEVPNGTGPTISAAGQIAYDTTDMQLLVGTSTSATPAVFRGIDTIHKFKVPSTSPMFATSSATNLFDEEGYTVTDIFCFVEGGTSKAITVFGESITCDADGAVDDGAISINTVGAASTTVTFTAGNTSGVVNWLNVQIKGTWTRE